MFRESKDKFFNLDTIMGLIVFMVAVFFMFSGSSSYLGTAEELDSQTLKEVRQTYYQPTDHTSTLVVFSTSWCGVCRALERDLDKREIEYYSVDVEKSAEGRSLYAKVYGQSNGPVPVVVAGKRVILGYDMDLILKALKES